MARKLVFDRSLFVAVMVLLGLGLVMVYSASAVLAREQGYGFNPLFAKQALAAALGLAVMLLAMHVDYRVLRRPAVVYGLVLGALGLLAAVLFAPELNNSRRWLFLGPISIQPSELAKLAIIPFVAYQIERKAERINSYSFLVPAGVVTAVMAALILFGGDLTTAVLLTAAPLAMVFLAGISWRFIAAGLLMTLPLLMVSIFFMPYRMKRWTAFLDPTAEPLGSGFQLLQSLIAVGSGGFFGLGPGGSMQKLYFLPSPHADFIFAIVAEELGFVGAVLVVGLIGLFLWRGVVAGQEAPDEFGRYLAWGFTAMVGAQALIHISVALGLLPTTGVPLPLISHGGTSLVSTLVACGLVLNISQHR